ncbi:hypothetical protein D9M72_563950 [compost metagenome]
MHDAVAGDIVEGFRFAHVFRLAADDDTELHFPVGLFRAARNDQVVVRADDRRRRLHEDDRFGGNLGAGLSRVIGIVEADADELAGSGDTGTEPLVAVDDRQAGEIECL